MAFRDFKLPFRILGPSCGDFELSSRAIMLSFLDFVLPFRDAVVAFRDVMLPIWYIVLSFWGHVPFFRDAVLCARTPLARGRELEALCPARGRAEAGRAPLALVLRDSGLSCRDFVQAVRDFAYS